MLEVTSLTKEKKFLRLITTDNEFSDVNKSDLSSSEHDLDKVIFNFSSYISTESDKSLLCKELNFAIAPKNIEYADCLLPFELLFRDIKSDIHSSTDFELIKTRLKDIALSSYQKYNSNISPSNLSKEEFEAFNNLI